MSKWKFKDLTAPSATDVPVCQTLVSVVNVNKLCQAQIQMPSVYFKMCLKSETNLDIKKKKDIKSLYKTSVLFLFIPEVQPAGHKMSPSSLKSV